MGHINGTGLSKLSFLVWIVREASNINGSRLGGFITGPLFGMGGRERKIS